MKKRLTGLISRLPAICLVFVVAMISGSSISAFAEGTNTEYQIKFQDGIHYLPDADASDGKIILYCLNNKSNWPHSIPGNITEEQVPFYIDGYLTADDFSSEEEYWECMNRLSAILYAGYPHNALRLYQIRSEGYVLTEDDFNRLLVVPNNLRADFASSLGDTIFTYADYTDNNTDNLNKLHRFLVDLGELFPDGRTESGLSYGDITAMPFYKAAFCMDSADEKQTPLQVFGAMYGGIYYVTEEQACNATQNAVWKLMYSYGVADNDMHDISSTPLGEILLEVSKTAEILKVEPEEKEVQIHSVSDDYTFTYNPEDKLWYSDEFRISENSSYNGEYVFRNLPSGITVITEHGENYVHEGEMFYFVSNHSPEGDEKITITCNQKWMRDLRQYSPKKTESGEDVIINGKKFQNMAGALVFEKNLSFDMILSNDETISDSTGDTATTEPPDSVGQSESSAPGNNNMQTGDTEMIGLYIAAAVISLIGIASIFVRKGNGK